MKSTVVRYGFFSAIAIFILSMVNYLLIAKKADFAIQEAAGYLAMFISMIFVFMGIRYYRDHVNDGALSFGQGLKMGILIVLIPAIFFGLFDILYTQVIDPSWSQHYFDHYLEDIRRTTAPEKLDAALKKAEEQRKLFGSPVMQFVVMTITVFVIGLIVAIISALALRKKKIAIS